jgi:hypothetical protein
MLSSGVHYLNCAMTIILYTPVMTILLNTIVHDLFLDVITCSQPHCMELVSGFSIHLTWPGLIVFLTKRK